VLRQDPTGGRAFAWPTNVIGGPLIGSAANQITTQTFLYDGTSAIPVSRDLSMKNIALILILSCAAFGQHVRASSANEVLNPLSFSGSDIGAQINAAAATCTSTSQCTILIPPQTAQLPFSTSIVFVNNQTVECAPTSVIGNDASGDPTTQLKYTGSGTAVTMNSIMGRFKGCGLILGSSASVGFQVANYGNHIVDAGVRDGGAGTTMIHIGSAAIATEDNHLERVRISNWQGAAISVDHANDTYLTNITSYGKSGAGTGTGLLVDDNTGGLIIESLVCGNCGHNGYWERHTLGGNIASFVFARNAEFDLSSADGMLFDSSLASANIDASFVTTFVAAAGGAGIHISGGSGITVSAGGIIRVNQGDGVLIDVTSRNAEFATIITGNNIQGNNQSNAANKSGIRITGHPGTTVITGNTLTNYPEVGGNQAYGLNAQSDVEGLTFTGNVCSQNVTGCMNVSSVTGAKLNVVGNVDTTTGPAASFMPGALTVLGTTSTGGHSMITTSGTDLLCSATQPRVTAGFNTTGTIGGSPNGSCSFFVTVGSGTATNNGTIGLPTAANGWNCFAVNQNRGAYVAQTSNTANSVVLTNYGNTLSATNFTNGDNILVSCFAR
jgi:hypothetical protein